MAPNSIKRALADSLENLSKRDLEKFCHYILDRREEPRVRRNRLEGKTFLEVVDVLVSTFTETTALQVTVQTLTEIGCSEEAQELVRETAGLH